MPEGPREPLLGIVPERSAECERLIYDVAAHVEARVGEVSRRLIDRVVHEMALPADDEDLREGLLAAARGSLGLVTAMARSWTDPHVVPPPQDALIWARGLVARGLSIDALLRVYRIGQSGYHDVWQTELASSGADPAVVLEAIAAMSAFTFTWVDAISGPLVQAYEDERARRLRGADAVRSETVQALLSGAAIDEQTASARLGYRLDRQHLGLIAWVEAEAPPGDLDDLEACLSAVAIAVAAPGSRPLVLRESPRIAIGWVVPGRLEDLAGTVSAAVGEHAVRIAAGTPSQGIDGFRATHDQGRRARRVARLLHRDAQVTSYAQVAVLDLLTQDVEAARRLTRRTLGPLAEDTGASRRLLTTLSVFVAQGQSFARAAPLLGVHENTVAYRVRRAVELAGAVDERTLWAAVELAPLLDS